MADENQLIAAIAADPDDEAGWLVYADWLLERDDPRGELIHIGIELDGGNVSRRLRGVGIESDEETALSPRLYAQSRFWKFTWHRGFFRDASYHNDAGRPPDVETLAALLDDPRAALLASLGLSDDDLVPLWADVFDRGHARLEVLGICGIGSFGRSLDAFPRLTSLGIHDFGPPTTELSQPGLRSLSTSTGICPPLTTGVDLPSLRTLSCDGSTSLFTETTSILRRPPPTLADLTLSGGDEVCRRMSEVKLLEQLEELYISKGRLSELDLLRERADQFRHLKKFTLSVVDQVDYERYRAIGTEFEALFPGIEANFYCDFVPPPMTTGPSQPYTGPRVDAQSRNADGRIDAMAAWMQGEGDD
ncbi:MAG: TIGR02996 domain-containing protein [Kofleriaceae bacterium]